jgi:signal transduction histidine kinase
MDRSLTVKGMEVINSAAGSELLFHDGRFLHPALSKQQLLTSIQSQFTSDAADPLGDPIYMRVFDNSTKSLALISHNLKMHDLVQTTLGSTFELPSSETINCYFLGKTPVDKLRVVEIRIPREPYVLQLASPWKRYEDTLGSMLTVIIEIVIFGFALSAFGGWLLVTKTLRPITEIVTEASKMNGNQLEPSFVAAHTKTDDEIGHLVTALNAMMARVHQAIVSQRQFTADASHDLRTPLAILQGEIELVLNRDRTVDEYRRVLLSALEETQRLTHIVNDLRELARADFESKNILRRTPVDLADLTTTVVKSRLRQAELLGISVSTEGTWRTTMVNADESAVGRAIANLLDNAITYNTEGGSVVVKLQIIDGCAVVSVTDTGVGISEPDCGRIFDRFYRGNKSRPSLVNNASSNTGLGLAIVKAVAVAHGGDVNVTSTIGEGSSFSISFPAAN